MYKINILNTFSGWKPSESKEYKANQNSVRLRELRRLVKKEKKEAMSKRIKKVVEDTGGSHAWVKKVEMLCDPAGDKPKKEVVLPAHAEEGLDKQQQAEAFAEHISRISSTHLHDATGISGLHFVQSVYHTLVCLLCLSRTGVQNICGC